MEVLSYENKVLRRKNMYIQLSKNYEEAKENNEKIKIDELVKIINEKFNVK